MLGIKSGRFSCGQSWGLEEYDDVEFQCFAATQRTVPDQKDMMPAHGQFKIGDLKEREALYIQFNVKKSEVRNPSSINFSALLGIK